MTERGVTYFDLVPYFLFVEDNVNDFLFSTFKPLSCWTRIYPL